MTEQPGRAEQPAQAEQAAQPGPAAQAPPAGAERTARPPSAPLVETARRIGGHAWVETRLFELLGRWAVSRAVADAPAASECLARQSRHHGWHVELWLEHLPDVPGAGPTDVVAPPDAGTAAAYAALDAAPPGSAVEALAATYRVLIPRLVTGYHRHLRETSPVADRPVARTLRIVLDDLAADRVDGDALLCSLLVDDTAAARAAAATERLDTAFSDAVG